MLLLHVCQSCDIINTVSMREYLIPDRHLFESKIRFIQTNDPICEMGRFSFTTLLFLVKFGLECRNNSLRKVS